MNLLDVFGDLIKWIVYHPRKKIICGMFFIFGILMVISGSIDGGIDIFLGGLTMYVAWQLWDRKEFP